MHTFVLNQSKDSCMIIQINILFKALMVLSANTKLCCHYGEKNYIWKAKEHQEQKMPIRVHCLESQPSNQ
jgi:hypothetical protein